MEDRENHRQNLGRQGENIACEYLKGIGHTILERNWRSGHREIDIISIGADGIHFVEVKTRRKSIQAPPQMNVDHTKQRNITNAARRFLRTAKGLPYSGHECHFDVVAVTFTGNDPVIEWFPQAYIPIFI